MSLLKVNEVQNYNGSSLTLTASTVSTSAQLNTGGNVSVTGSINVSDDSTTRSNLGLGSIATQDSSNVSVTGGSITGTTIVPTSPFSFRNRIINGDMRIDQRNAGSAVTVNGDYTVDRFRIFCPAGTFTSQQVSVTGTNAPSEFDKCIKINVTSGSAPSSAQGGGFVYKIEGNDIYDFNLGLASAKTFTLSFWAKASRTGTYCCGLQNTGSDRSYVFEYELTADVWSKITETVSGDITGTWLNDNGIGLDVRWSIGAGSDATASPNQWVDSSSVTTGKFQTSNQVALQTLGGDFSITGVQLEEGTVATPFEHRPISVELSLAQRYFETNRGDGWDLQATGMNTGVYYNNNASALNTFFALPIQFNTVKRASPSVKIYATYSGNVDKVSTNYSTNADADSTVAVVTKNGFSGGVGASPGGAFNVIDFNWTAESEL